MFFLKYQMSNAKHGMDSLGKASVLGLELEGGTHFIFNGYGYFLKQVSAEQ